VLIPLQLAENARAARKEPDWELAIPHLKIEMQGTQQVSLPPRERGKHYESDWF